MNGQIDIDLFVQVLGRIAYAIRDAWYLGEFGEEDEARVTESINKTASLLHITPEQARQAYENLLDPVARDILDACTADWLFEFEDNKEEERRLLCLSLD